ncbi:kinase-like protein [Aspergillus steynii IBT 23096]|uniref:Kinase-like protein n=1 Tax=Aspergillus steynii IBT 23096 TaxID=1392250 RepID=A0A2I2GF04_9EURO|nr:kinase-like protein [Aspergillus steynii IBT 23096]PLB51473.1 kinase-like protein [Aspergillus steynii IBT 23096]
MDLALFYQSNLLYHPLNLGDTFENGRYKIYHKLGWGGFSTVWLAKDNRPKKWVSLKIMTANARGSRELQNFKYIERHSEGNLSSNYIVQLLDSFTHEGPNGVHLCLVFKLLGPSVDKVLEDYHEGNDKLCPDTVLKMSTQLLRAVQFIHSSGMCHGDISGRNIAFSCSHLSNVTEEELFGVLGHPEIETLARIDGTPLENRLPSQLVRAADWVEWIDEDDEEIRLLDIGESFIQGEEPERLAQPGTLKVPKTIFTDRFDYRVDLWRTGCMIYSFLLTAYPFWYLGEDEVLVLQMIGFVEKLPSEWESKWQSMKMRSSRHLDTGNGKQMDTPFRATANPLRW